MLDIGDYFHSTSNVIFQLIENGKKVLDVGCGTGRLAEKLRIKKKCFVVGVETDQMKVEIAQGRCDRIIIADVETLKEVPFSARYFDIIIFADILEHLKKPDVILEKFKEYLKDDGYIVVSIPNVANWTTRLRLLLGKWNYKGLGLLDKTHLRFFTFQTAKKMLKNSGYTITHTICTSGFTWIDWRMPLRNPANIWKNLLAYQFVFKAVKRKEMEGKHSE